MIPCIRKHKHKTNTNTNTNRSFQPSCIPSSCAKFLLLMYTHIILMCTAEACSDDTSTIYGWNSSNQIQSTAVSYFENSNSPLHPIQRSAIVHHLLLLCVQQHQHHTYSIQEVLVSVLRPGCYTASLLSRRPASHPPSSVKFMPSVLERFQGSTSLTIVVNIYEDFVCMWIQSNY